MSSPGLRNWPIVGRDLEFAAITDGLRRNVGAVVVGESGVGKSALVGQVHEHLLASGQRAQLVLCSGRLDYPLPMSNSGGVDDEPQTIVVDDAHLLDDDSADVLWRAAYQQATRVVATVRAGEPVPDRVTRLWTGGSCARLDLAPLGVDDVRSLLEAVLDGDVEDRLPRLLVSRSAGNALLLRELIRSGVESGAITLSQQVWRLAGDLPVGAGAVDMVRRSLAELDADELQAAQLIAVGEPLRLEVAEALTDERVMEVMEDKRMITLVESAGGLVLTLAHPLYGEVLRSSIAPLRLRGLRRELVTAFARCESSHPSDVVRLVVWRMELGDTPPRPDLLAAARMAVPMSSSTAERLARAARADGASVDATLLLAEILVMQGRVAEAESLLDDVDLGALSPEERRALTYTVATGRTRNGELSEVIALITGAQVDASGDSRQLQAIYGQSLMLNGQMDEASEVVTPLFADHDADPTSRALAACALVARGAFSGRTSDSQRIMCESLPVAEAARTTAPFALATVMVAAAIGLAGAGELDEAEAIGHMLYDRAFAEDDEWMRPRGASALGVTALIRGRVRSATRYFRITIASLNRLDGQYLRYNLSYLARGAAVAGLVDEARQALHPAGDEPHFQLFYADWLIAEAALLAADGDFAAATEQALDAARHAASLGQWATMAIAAHDAARYTGSPTAAELLSVSAERAEGPLYRCQADFASARADDDPAALMSVSRSYEELGTILYAAEASYAAARAHRAGGSDRAAAAATLNASRLHARCENAAIPWASSFQGGEGLTRREQQVALRAAAGLSDASIAAQLHISVRTVQTHLTRTYRKLGIAGRRELPHAVGEHGAVYNANR